MLANKPKTKILVDGGDPSETLRIKSLLGFVDGQTTNPSLIAKNPEIQQLIASGHTLRRRRRKKRIQEDCPEHFAARGRRWGFHRSVCGSQYDSRGDACPGPGDVLLER